MDEPNSNSSLVPNYLLAKNASKKIKLSFQGKVEMKYLVVMIDINQSEL